MNEVFSMCALPYNRHTHAAAASEQTNICAFCRRRFVRDTHNFLRAVVRPCVLMNLYASNYYYVQIYTGRRTRCGYADTKHTHAQQTAGFEWELKKERTKYTTNDTCKGPPQPRANECGARIRDLDEKRLFD